MADRNGGFYSWDGKLYKSDIVRACIRPKVRAIGKLAAKHIRKTVTQDGTVDIKVNPDAYIRFLLEEPNPYMTGQMLQEKLAAQLCLNGNAFAAILRGMDGLPESIYPIPAVTVERVDKDNVIYLRFFLKNGQIVTFLYSDIIHLRGDFFTNELFGDSPAPALAPLMEIVSTTDQGIVKAIKNSSVIQWLLKLTSVMRPEDLKKQAKQFADNYLSIDSDSVGVAATDSKGEAIRIDPKDYVPNAAQMDRTTERIYSFLNTNRKIVQSDYSEDEWIAYFEAQVEPDAIQLSNEMTRRIFTRRERGFGNKIYFEAASLQYASMSTKLALLAMVDRGAMTPNEWREALNLGPIEEGDKPIRRLDTQVVNQKGGGNQ